ncbi:hypothetical protein F8M41_010724 [Gigaspora margarita]|uniref:BACK domain-containing protein n=1 Tax=Gigaspora margarita TaxID=4874 RepID=A0A8H3X288_GIGMA|nr:hypothetical protein F8M41_010724 [Gigaspora margarita]
MAKMDLRTYSDSNFVVKIIVEMDEILKNLKHSSWLFFNFVVSLNFVCHHNHFRKLYDFVLNFTCRNPYLLFDSIDLLSLDKVTLICLLERDDLEFEERDIWDYLIKWGIT